MTAEIASAAEPIKYTNYNLLEFQEMNRAKLITEYGCSEGQADVKLAGMFRRASFEVSKRSRIILSFLPVAVSALLGVALSNALSAQSAPVFQSGSQITPIIGTLAISMGLLMQVGTVYVLCRDGNNTALYKDQFIDGIPDMNAKGSMEVISGAEKLLFQDIENHRAKMVKKTKPTEPALKVA